MKAKNMKWWIGGFSAWALIGIIYFHYSREVWVDATSFQNELEDLSRKFNKVMTCKDWVEKIGKEDSGFLVMRGPFQLCYKVGRRYGKKLKCKNDILYVLCDEKLKNGE